MMAEVNEPPQGVLLSLVELFRVGKQSELETAALGWVEQYPRSVRLPHLLGVSRLAAGRNADAFEVLQTAHRRDSEDPEVENLLGVALFQLARHDEARAHFDASLARAPEIYETLINASANALALGDAEEGHRLASRAVRLRANGVEALFALGNSLLASGKPEEAIAAYRRVSVMAPANPDVHLNLGHALTAAGRHGEATAQLRQALALRPDYAPVHLNLGRALHELGDTAEAQRHFRAASDLDPNLAEAHSAYLFSLSHDGGVSPQAAFQEHVRIGDLMEAPHRACWRPHENDRDPERSLRVGFVSGDLHEHPVANLIEPVWRAMRGGCNRICIYANGTWRDAVETRLRALVDEWVQVERMNDDALSERIRADRIDILFDLSGHTARNRLPVFARKPAPVQVTWIGYPGTTGLSAMDYRLVRGLEFQTETLQAQFREKLVHLGARSFELEGGSPEVNELPALKRDWLTFGSFNRPSKLGAGVIALWSRVLRAIPRSRLLIAGVGEQGVRDRLETAFLAEGVEAERLEFRPRLPLRDYLAMHHDVDVAFDTFPYAGGTTTLFALWMGVPVLTLTGTSLQQNSTTSSLRAMGLSEWAAPSESEFVRRAISAAADLPALGRLRAGLRATAEQVFREADEQMGREMDSALRTMWRRWCAGQAPEGFVVRD